MSTAEKKYEWREVDCPWCDEGYHYEMASRFNARRMELEDYDIKTECGECEGTGRVEVEFEIEEEKAE